MVHSIEILQIFSSRWVAFRSRMALLPDDTNCVATLVDLFMARRRVITITTTMPDGQTNATRFGFIVGD